MTKICFINAYETSYLGTRILATYMLKQGHSVHNILLGSGEYIQIEEPSSHMKDINTIPREISLLTKRQNTK